MAVNSPAAKQNVIHFIHQVPFSDEDKETWLAQLEENNVTEELLNTLHTTLMALPTEKFGSDWMKMKFSADLAGLIRQWRMSNARRQFKHGR